MKKVLEFELEKWGNDDRYKKTIFIPVLLCHKDTGRTHSFYGLFCVRHEVFDDAERELVAMLYALNRIRIESYMFSEEDYYLHVPFSRKAPLSRTDYIKDSAYPEVELAIMYRDLTDDKEEY